MNVFLSPKLDGSYISPQKNSKVNKKEESCIRKIEMK